MSKEKILKIPNRDKEREYIYNKAEKEKNLSDKEMYFCEDDSCIENAHAFNFHKKVIVYSKEDVKKTIKRLEKEFPVGTVKAVLKEIFGDKLI